MERSIYYRQEKKNKGDTQPIYRNSGDIFWAIGPDYDEYNRLRTSYQRHTCNHCLQVNNTRIWISILDNKPE